MGRPGILTLKTTDGRTGFVLLTALGTTTARIHGASGDQQIALEELAMAWHGGFSTLWRTPPHYRPGAIGPDQHEVVDWLRHRFAVLDGASLSEDSGSLERRIAAFQMANGLEPDGIAGPVTFMKLNRISHVSEPRLLTDP